MGVEAGVRVDWYGEDVSLVAGEALEATLAEVALQVEGQAKVNVVANDQVDTGFMLNSLYVITGERSGFGAAKGGAKARNPEARMAPETRLPEGAGAAVVAGADYSIYQEIIRSFLYRALEQVRLQVDGIIKRVGKEHFG